MEITIDYKPNEKQNIFHNTKAPYAVYGGARGGGKTKSLIMDVFIYALTYPGSHCYIFRETYPNLEANVIREWIRSVPAELYKYSDQKHIATLKNGSHVLFRYVKNDKDAESYQGQEFDYLGIDELTKHTERTAELLTACLRSAKGFPVRFRGSCNPGGRGHGWVKRKYVEATNYGENPVIDETTGLEKVFIPARVYDNYVLMANDPSYVKRLEALPEQEKKAFLYGDWDVFIGQVFTEFNRNIHVEEPFEIPKGWIRVRSMDWGFSKPFSIHWYAIDYEGVAHCYREYYGCTGVPDVGLKLIPDEVAAEMARLSEGETYAYDIADRAIWQKDDRMKWSVQGESIAEIFARHGINFIKSNSERIPGKMMVHTYLREKKIKFFSTCKHILRTLPELVYDESKPEDVDTTQEDHAYDEFRYFCMSRPITPKKPEKPFNDGYKYDDETEGEVTAWGV